MYKPLGEASNKGAASTFGGVSTSDSEECRPYALDVAITSTGETSDVAAASLTATGGKLTQCHSQLTQCHNVTVN